MVRELLMVGEFHLEQTRAILGVLSSEELRSDFAKDMCATIVNRLKEINGPEYVEKLSENDLQELRKKIDESFKLAAGRAPPSLTGDFLPNYLESLATIYEPDVIFTEGSAYTYGIGYDMRIPIVPFKEKSNVYDGQSLLNYLMDRTGDDDYEQALIQMMVDTASNYNKTLAVIGTNHLKRACSKAKRSLHVEAINCSPVYDFIVSLFEIQ